VLLVEVATWMGEPVRRAHMVAAVGGKSRGAEVDRMEDEMAHHLGVESSCGEMMVREAVHDG
jgi:hypothetical protein